MNVHVLNTSKCPVMAEALQPSSQTTCGATLELRNIVKRQQDFLLDVMQMCRGTVTVAALARALSEC